eukprot:snap_masked-scaffold_3-processed-gene-7.5-mRNA-1 protein AED:1.00 eAED:1.00 QI:0/-1/0/0/-1/1/1/0/286
MVDGTGTRRIVISTLTQILDLLRSSRLTQPIEFLIHPNELQVSGKRFLLEALFKLNQIFQIFNLHIEDLSVTPKEHFFPFIGAIRCFLSKDTQLDVTVSYIGQVATSVQNPYKLLKRAAQSLVTLSNTNLGCRLVSLKKLRGLNVSESSKILPFLLHLKLRSLIISPQFFLIQHLELDFTGLEKEQKVFCAITLGLESLLSVKKLKSFYLVLGVGSSMENGLCFVIKNFLISDFASLQKGELRDLKVVSDFHRFYIERALRMKTESVQLPFKIQNTEHGIKLVSKR